MAADPFGARYLEIRRVRLQALARRGLTLSPRDIETFEQLEDRMNSGNLGEDWLQSFQLSNDDYMRLLHKVLKAAVRVGEPHSQAKLQDFIEEKGTQGPAVYNTPWDMTLADLDRNIGDFEDVASFYESA